MAHAHTPWTPTRNADTSGHDTRVTHAQGSIRRAQLQNQGGHGWIGGGWIGGGKFGSGRIDGGGDGGDDGGGDAGGDDHGGDCGGGAAAEAEATKAAGEGAAAVEAAAVEAAAVEAAAEAEVAAAARAAAAEATPSIPLSRPPAGSECDDLGVEPNGDIGCDPQSAARAEEAALARLARHQPPAA